MRKAAFTVILVLACIGYSGALWLSAAYPPNTAPSVDVPTSTEARTTSSPDATMSTPEPVVAPAPAPEPTPTPEPTPAPIPAPTPAPTPEPAPGTYTTTQVAAHSSSSSCWLIVHGNVYDVTSYIPSHPGGRQRILNECGREVTSIFASIHSNRAWDLLGGFKIGTLAK